MAKPKGEKISEIIDPRTGKKITVAFDPKVSPKGKAKIVYDPMTHKNAHKDVTAKSESAKQKKGKVPITTAEAPKLKDVEQKVLDFLKSLDHPATSNEVRDKFGFPLRQNSAKHVFPFFFV